MTKSYEDGFTHGYDAYLADYIDGGGLDGHATWAQATRCQDTDIALYTHPKEWQGLSDDDISYTWAGFAPDAIDFARAIEAKLKDKNT